MTVDSNKISIAVPAHNTDKIFYTTSGSYSVTGSNPNADPMVEYGTFAHGKGEAFFVEIQLSLDSVTWYPAEFPPFAYNAFYGLFLERFRGAAYVDSTSVHLFLRSTQTTQTLYYRIAGFSRG